MNYKDLLQHLGHSVVIVAYNKNGYVDENKKPQNISLECETCNEVITSFDK